MYKKKIKNILIIGGTGFIGYHLIKYLLKKKFNVISISTKRPKKIRRIKGIKYIYEDVVKLKKLIKIKNQFDHVVNLSGYVDHSNKEKTYITHYLGCINLFKLFKNSKIKSFIQIGSSLEYGSLKSPQLETKGNKPKSVYSKSKFLATNFLLKKYKLYKFPAVILRGYQVYGPRQDNNRLIPIVINKSLTGKSFPCSHGNQYRDFLFVDDFVVAIYKSMLQKRALGKIINIGYGKPIKVKYVITKIRKIIKKGKPIFNKIKLRPDESNILYPSISRAKRILGWRPQTNFEKGIKLTIKDFKRIKK